VIGKGAAHAVQEADEQENTRGNPLPTSQCVCASCNAFDEEKDEASPASKARVARESESDTCEESGIHESGAVDGADLGSCDGKPCEQRGNAGDQDGAPHGHLAGLFCFFKVADIRPNQFDLFMDHSFRAR